MNIRDLKPSTISVDIVMVYSVERDPKTNSVTARTERKVETIEMRLLSRHEWEEIGFSVDDPAPPKKADGTPDFNAMSYRQAVARVAFERDVRRLAAALSIEGNPLGFEGDTFEERAEELKHLDTGIFNALFSQLMTAVNNAETKVSGIVNSFRSGNGNGVLQARVSDYSQS